MSSSSTSGSISGSASGELQRNLDEIAVNFRSSVDLQDRRYRLKTFKKCFIGSEAVDFMVASQMANSREDAVQLGQALASEFFLFEHVTRDHEFMDDCKFYHFISETERGCQSFNHKTGQTIKWGDFLDATKLNGSNGQDRNPQMPSTDVTLHDLDARDLHVAKHVWPLDEHNQRLLNNVHPPDWNDPSPRGDFSYDLVVIGGGPAGLVTAAGAAGVGAKVALIECHLLGGDCLNVGCVPSKALIHSANLAHTLRGDMERLNNAGVFIKGGADNVGVDFGKVMERIRKLRADISHHDSAERFSKELGVHVYIGRGKFSTERTIEVNGKTINFKKAVIATGGYPGLIKMKGLKTLHDMATGVEIPSQPRPAVVTNETLFNLTRQPRHLIVIGAGVIGIEMAQAMQRLGTAVTVLGGHGRILPKEDEDMAELVMEQMRADGVKFNLGVTDYLGIKLTGAVQSDNLLPEMKMKVCERGGNHSFLEMTCDAVLVAAGRLPNVTGMNLEVAGVKYSAHGGLDVNDKLQTTNPRIFGVGDVASQYKFTHAADFMARTVIKNALFFGSEKLSSLLIPYATFTSPEIASVGLYEKDLKKKGVEYRIFEKSFHDNDRAITDDERVGFVRFRVDAKTDKILGASIVGKDAGNMISEITLAMQSETGLGSLAAVIHPYPTTAEVVRQAGDVYNKTRLTNTVKQLLRGIIKMQR